jgi:ribosome-associated protein
VENNPAKQPVRRRGKLTSEKIARLCAELAGNKKAEQIVALDMRKISSFTDYFVVCSGTSEPQLKAIANEIQERLKKDYGVTPHGVDGFPMSQWIVIDYSGVVVHVFHQSKRAFYGLENLWSDAPRLKLTAA